MDIFIITGGCVAFIVITSVIVIYNSIIRRMNAVARAWTDVVVQERQKNNVLPQLENLVAGYKEYETDILTQITRLRTDLKRLDTGKMDFRALADAHHDTTTLLNGIYAIAENYPVLKASGLYRGLMTEIAEQQQNTGAAIRIFNRNVEDFNNGIEIIPHSLVNRMFSKKRKLSIFNDSQAAGGFEYHPDIF